METKDEVAEKQLLHTQSEKLRKELRKRNIDARLNVNNHIITILNGYQKDLIQKVADTIEELNMHNWIPYEMEDKIVVKTGRVNEH